MVKPVINNGITIGAAEKGMPLLAGNGNKIKLSLFVMAVFIAIQKDNCFCGAAPCPFRETRLGLNVRCIYGIILIYTYYVIDFQ